MTAGITLVCAGGSGLGIVGIGAFHWRFCLPSAQGAGCVPPAAAVYSHGLAGAHQGLARSHIEVDRCSSVSIRLGDRDSGTAALGRILSGSSRLLESS